MPYNISRRAALLMGAAGGLSPFAALPVAANYVSSEDGYDYEIQRTEEEWRELLGDKSFAIMRQGKTEKPKSSPLWDDMTEGTYHCKACDLPVYESRWKVVLDKGWLFFHHGVANALLMGIDWPEGSDGQEQYASLAGIETHCRRCGSHMGHIVLIEGQQLHCINGASLTLVRA